MAARLAPVNWTFLAAFLGASMFVGLLAGFDPKFAIAASLAASFALIVFADLTAGLALFVFFSFLELLGTSSVVSVGKIGGVFLAIAWLGLLVSRGETKINFISMHSGMTLVLGLFLGWVALSALWAESTPVVVGSFFRYLLNVILLMIVFTAIQSKRQALYVIGGFVGGAGAAALYGLVFAPSSASAVYGERITGAGLDPNELASVLVAGIALSIGLAICLKGKPGLRLAAYCASGFCFLAALLTGSRGGIVALVCMLIAAILFSGRYRGRVAVASALLAVVGFYYIAALAPADIRDRIKSSSQGETRQMEGRTTLWQIGERMVRAHPVNGIGAGNFEYSSRHYLLQPGTVYRSDVVIFTPQVTHNTYLQIAAELGLVGFVLFGSVVVFSVGSALRGARHFRFRGDLEGEGLAICVAVALVGVLAADIFISQQFNKQLWLLLGIGPAILSISKRPDAEA